MAAPYVTVVRRALKGAHLVPGQWLLRTRCPTATLCQSLRLQTALRRPLHVCQAASLCSSRTEPQKHNTADTNTDHRTTEEEEEEEEGPEYIPRKKAKNPMMMIGYAWIIGLPAGIITFLLAKREVDKNRLKQLKVRQRMRRSNDGDYEGSRYRHHTNDVKLDQ